MEAAGRANLAPTEMGVRAITTGLKSPRAKSPPNVCPIHHPVLTLAGCSPSDIQSPLPTQGGRGFSFGPSNLCLGSK